ncbi:hypothetical protein H2203_006686 [Taxawa tesnikishii (nom. ined.)]|nr:hypothetical protein H2203_006686 [Dothideales sp. JES 119]
MLSEIDVDITNKLQIIRGYISRKRSFFEAPEWLEISKEGSQTDMMTRLLDIAIKVPGLLEDTDNALGSGDEALAMKVMTDVVDALQRFHHWLTRWHDAIGEESYHLQDIEEFPAFVETCDDRTFPKAFKFRSFQNGYLHCKYWLCRCFLQKAIMDLLARYPNLPCAWTPKEIDQDLLGDAINICQAIPYFCQPAASSTGRFSTFVPLRFVTLFFEARKMRAQQRWGEKVAATIYSQGIAPPSLRQGYFLWRPYLYGK